MRVVFVEDVPNVANTGEIKEVSDGYGRNFLIPHKLALPASPAAIDMVAAQLKSQASIQARTEAELLDMANSLEGKEVILEVRTGSKDRLYGSITAADIAAGLESCTGLAIDRRKIELNKPIRQVGSYEVGIKLAKDITPKIKVTVSGKTA